MDLDFPLQKRGDPYFPDGNIFLMTDEDQTVFKVHRGVLARHSDVFDGMFQFSQPADCETIDGCQVVRMYDLPNELSNLIKALYDGPNFQTQDFFYLVGVLRLATKYFITNLRHDAMVELAIKSPTVNGLTFPYVHPVFVLNLALEAHVRVIIPSSAYFLSLYPLDALLRRDHPKLQVEHPSRPSADLDVTVLQYYSLMFQKRLDIILDFTRRLCGERSPSPTCSNRQSCNRGFARLTARLSRSWMPRTGPFFHMLQAVAEVCEDTAFCSSCQEAFRRDVAAFRESSWEELPSILGLPSWNDMYSEDLA